MIRLIIILLVIILVLSLFGISLQSLFNAPTTQANFAFAWSLVIDGWNLVVHFFANLPSALGMRAS